MHVPELSLPKSSTLNCRERFNIVFSVSDVSHYFFSETQGARSGRSRFKALL